MRDRPAGSSTALRLVAAIAVMVAALAVTAPGTGAGGAPAGRVGAPGSYAEPTRMSAATWRARQGQYLAAATAGALDPTEPTSLVAFAERDRRDPGFDGDLSAATAATFDDILGDGFSDDFTVSTLLTLWINYHDQLEPSLAAAIKAKLLGWKYWWTEEPLTVQPGANYYWTENHNILFASEEYLVGQAFPDETFANGMTGRQRMAHALPNIRRWVELRAAYGFSEFLSNPYTAYSFEGALSLAELADDPAVADLASQVLDMMLVEVASHLHDGVLGSTMGRSYKGNLFNLQAGSTPSLIELVFNDGPPQTGSGPTTAMAVANRYRPPEVARRIAATKQVAVVRQYQGIPLDPTAPVVTDPVAPDDLTFQGDDGLVVWWGMGAQLSWQVVPLSIATIRAYNLWDTPNFQAAGANVLQTIVAGKTDAQLQALAHGLGGWLNPGLLSAVNTYTWRSGDAALSTAQDWRAGQRTESALVSRAVLADGASVFVSHPKGKATDGAYWSGDGAAPRAAQHDRSTISVYAPQYKAPSVTGPNGYQPITHAFFPTERFDQVVQRDGWIFGRKGNGYVALWSWRPTHFEPVPAGVPQEAGLTQPYDLVADGGPDNAWITHVGRAADFAGRADPFDAFVTAVSGRAPVVRPMAGGTPCAAATPDSLGSCAHAIGDGFLVDWAPTEGPALGFGWSPKASTPKPPLTVDGAAVALDDPAHRWDSPWATAGRDGRYHVAIDGAVLDLALPAARVDLPRETTTTTTTTTTTSTTSPPSSSTTPPPGGVGDGVVPYSDAAVPVSGDADFTG